MATALTKFQIRIPIYQGTDANGNISSQDQARVALLHTLGTIIPEYSIVSVDVYNNTGFVSQYNEVYGLLTSAQNTQALNALNTYIASVSFSVLCYINPVTTQP